MYLYGGGVTLGSKNDRSVGMLTGIFLSVSLSFVLSLVGTLLGTRNNGRFSVVTWLITFAASTFITMVLGLIIPIGRAAKAVSKSFKLKENGIPARLVETLVADIIYTPIISFLMVFIARSFAIANGAPPQALKLGNMFLLSFPGVFATGYVFIFIFVPLFEKLAKKIVARRAQKDKLD